MRIFTSSCPNGRRSHKAYNLNIRENLVTAWRDDKPPNYQFYLSHNVRHELSLSKRTPIWLILSRVSGPFHLQDA